MKRIKFFSCCWKATPARAFNELFTNFFNFGKFVKIREFFCWGNEFSIYGDNYIINENDDDDDDDDDNDVNEEQRT